MNQMPYQTYPYQPPKKRLVWPWVLGGVLLVMFLGMAGCAAFVGLVAHEVGNTADRGFDITYEAGGTGSDTVVTYTGDTGSEQHNQLGLPWNKKVHLTGLTSMAVMTVTNGNNGGTVACRIRSGDRVLAEQTSTGPYTSATCTASAS